MDVSHIKNIDSLIQLEAGKKIQSHKVKRLTAPGENYGSLMLSVDLTLQTPESNEEELHLVAKTLPPNNFIQEVFNSKVTFRNEIGFYKYVIPVLQKFQKENGIEKVIDFAPKYYGSRLNLNNDDNSAVDSDAALILENLKTDNYSTVERTEGLDVVETKLILENLASFHGVALALKLKNRKVFEDEIQPFLHQWKSSPNHYNKLKKDLIRITENTPELQLSKEKILKEFEQQMIVKEAREPFATISHNDCWSNNTMFKFENSQPVKSKIIDYQMCSYGSPAKDVIFFLFTSVKEQILEKYYDEFIKFYYHSFVSILKELKCDTKPFSFEAFLNEIDYEARNSQFAHIAFMLFPIYADKNNVVKDISEFTPENLISENDSDQLKKKFVSFVNEFLKKKWIYN